MEGLNLTKIKKIMTRQEHLKKIIKVPTYIKEVVSFILNSMLFFILLNIYFLPIIFFHILHFFHINFSFVNKLEKRVDIIAHSIVNKYSTPGAISRWQLIKLASRSMSTRKNRTFITVFGVAIGIGAVVFLLSIGYGAETLVKNRVATLDQVKQTNIYTNDQTKLPINDKLLTGFKSLEGVEDVQPIASIVGKVEYNNSNVDVVVLATSNGYLENSDIKLKSGTFFTSEQDWSKEYDNADIASYLNDQKVNAPIVSSTTDSVNVSDQKVLGISDSTTAKSDSTTTETSPIPEEVKNLSSQLGLESAEVYQLLPELSNTVTKDVVINFLSAETLNEAVVSEGFLTATGMDKISSDPVGKEFNVQFTLIGGLIPQLGTQKVLSSQSSYKIIGIIPGSNPLLYIPLQDLKTLGIKNYSEARIIANKDNDIPSIRKAIEGRGYLTQSVQDTLDRIQTLFSGVRVSLLLLGILALSVASLGMFNTLTVSLLERTHEVGLLKAMGMKSTEVKKVFLSESLILGFFGGVVGLILGYLLGYILNMILSFFL